MRQTAATTHGELRFTEAADGTKLAWRASGSRSDPALVFVNGYTTTADYFRDLIERFSGRARIVTWDFKGHGESGPAKSMEAVGIEQTVDDLARVMDAAEVESATLLAFSMGCQIILESWRHIPRRIDGLVPMLGMYGQPFDHLFHPRLGPVLLKVLDRTRPLSTAMLRAAWVGTRSPLTHFVNQRTGMIGKTVSRAQMANFYSHFKQLHGPTWAAMGVAAQRHSAADLLDRIDAPTYVVSGGRDSFTPSHLSCAMVERIPDCEQLYVPEATHAGLFEYPELIGSELEEFLVRRGLIRVD